MKFRSFLVPLMTISLSVDLAYCHSWEAGELTYPSGETEISAFANTPGNTQLQAVLCSKDSPDNYRFTLLLPNKVDADSVIKVVVQTDDSKVEEYAEVSGNSLDLQVDERLLAAVPDTSSMTLIFDKEDADYLGIPEKIDVDMHDAELTLKNVASQCTALCLNNDFKCSYPLLSSILWPRDRFSHTPIENIDDLCTTMIRSGLYRFKLSDGCKLALDRFYHANGEGVLSYVEKLFNQKNGSFDKYIKSWNDAVSLSPSSALNPGVRADKSDWYLTLYSLVGKRKLKEFPNSFDMVIEYKDDPTTLVYDIDIRYEMELLKYSSVLYRRVRGNVTAINAVEKSLKMWQDFYRKLSASLPNINQAQAIRPIVYRQMLMRVWKLAGRPQALRFVSENAFRQGTNGKTTTKEPLESVCSFFEGASGEQFYFGSDKCIQGIEDYMRTSPLKNMDYDDVVNKWDAFSKGWTGSIFYHDSLDDAVGETKRGNLGIALLSLFKNYGFGDYFLLRECISSRDRDICEYEANKAYDTYSKEFNYRLDSISNVNSEDGSKLNELNKLWQAYYHALEVYVDNLADSGIIPMWKADFVKGVACVVQTNALLNFPYDREQLPDISSDLYQKAPVENTQPNDQMTIEQYKYDDYDDLDEDEDMTPADDDEQTDSSADNIQ